MKQIRYNVFETNSSSTHSLILMNETDYDKWVKGELILDDMYELCDTKDLELTEYIPGEDDWDEDQYMIDKDENRYFRYNDISRLDVKEDTIKTPNGDNVFGISIYTSE